MHRKTVSNPTYRKTLRIERLFSTEAIYKDVLGGDFKHDLGLLGDCYLDLFFLMVMTLNREDLVYLNREDLVYSRQ